MSINRFNRSNTSPSTRVSQYSKELVEAMSKDVKRIVWQTVEDMKKWSIKPSGNIFYLNPERSGWYIH